MSRSRTPTSILACVIAIAAATAGGGFAAPVRLGSEFQVNTYTTGLQVVPAVAVAGDGDFVVVWEGRQDGDEFGVFLRRFDAGGSALGAELQVNLTTVDDQRTPAVAADADGDFVVVWRSNGQDDGGLGSGVFGQRFDSAGGRVASEFQVNTHTFSFQLAPTVAMEAGGDFVVAWASNSADPGYGIRAQRFASTGAFLGQEFLVNVYTTDTQKNPTAAMDNDGDFVIAWTSKNQDGEHYGVFARRFGSNGAGLGAEFQVNTYTPVIQSDPAVAVDGDGDFVVAWRSFPQDGYQSGIFARRFASTGAALALELQVTTYTLTNQQNPAVAIGAGGDFVVVWESLNQQGEGGYGVFGRRFVAAGTALAGEFRINTFTGGGQSLPAVGSDTDGNLVVAWQSSGGQDGDFEGVFAQRFGQLSTLDVDGNGAVQALTDGLLVLRFAFQFTGTTLTNGVVGPGCSRCDDAAILPYLTGLGLQLDIDGNGQVQALTDGLLLLRFTFGFSGATLTSGATAGDCARCDAASIVPYLLSL